MRDIIVQVSKRRARRERGPSAIPERGADEGAACEPEGHREHRREDESIGIHGREVVDAMQKKVERVPPVRGGHKVENVAVEEVLHEGPEDDPSSKREQHPARDKTENARDRKPSV